MRKKKIIWFSVAGIFAIAAILDAIHYLKPDVDNKTVVQLNAAFPINSASEIVMVYNAWGGIYPGLVDLVHKEISPKTYPCNLCYQAFGTFGKKDEWKQFVAQLPYKEAALHKEEFQRLYEPKNMQLPVILLRNGKNVQLLLSAEELNQFNSLDELIHGVKGKLNNLPLLLATT